MNEESAFIQKYYQLLVDIGNDNLKLYTPYYFYIDINTDPTQKIYINLFDGYAQEIKYMLCIRRLRYFPRSPPSIIFVNKNTRMEDNESWPIAKNMNEEWHIITKASPFWICLAITYEYWRYYGLINNFGEINQAAVDSTRIIQGKNSIWNEDMHIINLVVLIIDAIEQRIKSQHH